MKGEKRATQTLVLTWPHVVTQGPCFGRVRTKCRHGGSKCQGLWHKTNNIYIVYCHISESLCITPSIATPSYRTARSGGTVPFRLDSWPVASGRRGDWGETRVRGRSEVNLHYASYLSNGSCVETSRCKNHETPCAFQLGGQQAGSMRGRTLHSSW